MGTKLGILRHALGAANGIAASTRAFDYQPSLAIQNSDGSTDTSDNTAVVTATITTGAGVLVGVVTKTATAGVADFAANIGSGTSYRNNGLGISGLGSNTITYSTPGLTSVAETPIVTVAPKYDAFALALGILVELPRAIPNTDYPTISSSVTVGPSGRDFTTVQAALTALVAADTALHREIICDNSVTVGASVIVPTRAAGMGKIMIRAATLPTAGQRVIKGSVEQLAMPVIASENPQGLFQCDDGAHDVYCVGLWFDVPVPAAGDATELFVVVDWTPKSTVTLATMPYNLGLDRCALLGKPTTRLRKAVAAQCGEAFIVNSWIDEVHDFFNSGDANHPNGSVIGGVSHFGNGNGDTNAIFCCFGTGPHYFFNNTLRSAGEVSIYGGTDPTIDQLIPGDITFANNLIQKPLAWQGIYPAKNNWELKNARRVLDEGNVHDGSWLENQDGTGILAASVNQGATAPWCGVLDLTFRNNFVRNMTAFLTFSSNNSEVGARIAQPTAGVSVHDNVGANINGMEAFNGDDINRMLLIAGLANAVFRHNTILAHPGNSTKGVILDLSSPATTVDDNVLTAEHYAVLAGDTAPGTASVTVGLPDDPFDDNVLIGVGVDGAVSIGDFPATSFYPATNADVGFVDASIVSSWTTADPDAVCAALALTAGSAYHARATDGLDPGADITAVRAAILGVLDGTLTAGGGGGSGGSGAPLLMPPGALLLLAH